MCADEEACVLGDDLVPSRSPIAGAGESRTSLGESAVADPFSSLPPMVTTSFRAATLEWGQQEDLGEAQSTPFRELNFDLLQRAVSREAALATLSGLNERPEAAASAQWLRSKLEVWLPRFEQPARTFLGAVFLVELLSSSPAPMAAADGSVGLSDPAMVVSELLAQRERIALEWSEWLGDSQAGNDELLRELLEEQLADDAAAD